MDKNAAAGKTMTVVGGATTAGAAATYKIGKYTTPFASEAEAWTALKRERRAELGMEGSRWFDLARWGEAASVLNAYRAYENKYFANKFANEYNVNWVTYPIPFSTLQTSMGRIVQNENWK